MKKTLFLAAVLGTVAYVASQPVAAAAADTLYTAPVFSGTEWVYNTGTSVFDATDRESTATPQRDGKGPVYVFDNVGTLTGLSTGSSVDTSDGGGVKVSGNSTVTTTIGRWAGSIQVEAGSVLNAAYSNQLKGENNAAAATVYAGGTLNFINRNNGTLDMADSGGGGQRWLIDAVGLVNLGGMRSVTKGNQSWDVQAVLTEADIQTIQNASVTIQDDTDLHLANRERTAHYTAVDGGRILMSGSNDAAAILAGIDHAYLFNTAGEALSADSNIGLAVSGGNIVAGAYDGLKYQAATLATSGNVTWVANGTGADNLFNGTSFMNGDTVTVRNGHTATLGSDITVAKLTAESGASIIIGEGKTLDASAQTFDRGTHRAIIEAAGGEGTLKLSTDSGLSELHTWANDTAVAVKTNLVYEGTGTLAFVGSDRHSGADVCTIAVGKTLSIADGGIWAKRSTLDVQGSLTADKVSLGHEETGNYSGILKIVDGGSVTTKHLAFENVGGGSKLAMSGGTLEFTQDADSAIQKKANASYTVEITGGTLKAESSSWHVDEDIAMSISNATIKTGAEQDITLKGTVTFATDAVLTIDGNLMLKGADTTIQSLTLNSGSVSLGTEHTADLITSTLTVNGSTDVNADLVIAEQGTVSFTGGVVTLGCSVTFGEGSTVALGTAYYDALRADGRVLLFTDVESYSDNLESILVTGDFVPGHLFAEAYTAEGGVTKFNIYATPEPATATLSLLALAALAARRRRH